MAPADEHVQQEDVPLLRSWGLAPEEAVQKLQGMQEEAANVHGLDLSMLDGDLSEELIRSALDFCKGTASGGAVLRFAHCDLGSGTNCEQRVFDLKAERNLQEMERSFNMKKKSESAKKKDFAEAAQMRRESTAAIEAADLRMAEIDKEMADLAKQQAQVPWHLLFSQLQTQEDNKVTRLDLSNCGLHATAMVMLQELLLELEHRGDGLAVRELVLDGNDLGDSSTVALASLLRLSSCLEVLRIRNIGITDGGFSQILSALVANKNLALLDLRGNGLCSLEINKAATEGFRRFNKTAQILLE